MKQMGYCDNIRRECNRAIKINVLCVLLFLSNGCGDPIQNRNLVVKMENPERMEWHKDSSSYAKFQRFNFLH